MSEPLISVIVPLYNSERFLDRCILSIVKQSYKNLEIILVDGGSEDGTEDICRDWMEEDKRIRYIYSTGESEGVSSSRNRGIDEATGDFITFIDSDDFISADMISHLYDMLDSHPKAQAAGCGFEISSLEGVPGWLQESRDDTDNKENIRNEGLRENNTEEKISIIDSDEYLHHNVFEGDTRCWSKLYRKHSTKGIRFADDLTIGEDVVFLIDFMNKSNCIVETNEKLYHYYQNIDGTMKKSYTHKAFDQVTCWERAFHLIGDSAKLRSILLVSIMLTVGRISCLPKHDWNIYKDDIKACKEKLRQYRTVESFSLLERGYKIKVRLFMMIPMLYMDAYHYLHG